MGLNIFNNLKTFDVIGVFLIPYHNKIQLINNTFFLNTKRNSKHLRE